MNIVAVTLTRGGSKRVPRKNVRPLGGKPLIVHTIEAVHEAKGLNRAIVSTDDAEIARVSRQAGAEVPFIRPANLATDDSTSFDALLHAVEWLERDAGTPVDVVVLLQPTSPFRRGSHIDQAIDLLSTNNADTVTAISPAKVHPYWAWTMSSDGLVPFFSRNSVEATGKNLPRAYAENGAIYVARRSVLAAGSLYGQRVVGFEMTGPEALDIDTEDDLAYAEFILGRHEEREADG